MWEFLSRNLNRDKEKEKVSYHEAHSCNLLDSSIRFWKEEGGSGGVALYYTLTSEFEFALRTRREGYKQSNSFDLSIDLDFEQG